MASWTSPKTWADAIALTAAELNTYVRDNLQYIYDRLGTQIVVLSSDVTKSSATFSDLTGLSFTVASGKNYMVSGFLTYEHSTTTGGPIISFNQPGGSARLLATYAGETSSTSADRDWVSTIDGGTGVATAVSSGTPFGIELSIRYQCTASGTFALRIARNTAGTTTIHKGSGITIVSD